MTLTGNLKLNEEAHIGMFVTSKQTNTSAPLVCLTGPVITVQVSLAGDLAEIKVSMLFVDFMISGEPVIEKLYDELATYLYENCKGVQQETHQNAWDVWQFLVNHP